MYARAAKAPATRHAYRSDFVIFRTWCESKGASPLPCHPEIVAAFLACEANRGIKPATMARRLAAIRYAHELAGHASPTRSEAVKATLRGIKRRCEPSPGCKTPATSDKIVAMATMTGNGPRGLRDRGKTTPSAVEEMECSWASAADTII